MEEEKGGGKHLLCLSFIARHLFWLISDLIAFFEFQVGEINLLSAPFANRS